jgi:antibiotic biosynthesis monooxygenase (ABM) superfamily enzyme
MSHQSSRHQMAVMIWIAVAPTLIVLQLVLGDLLRDAPVVLRTLITATIAVPIVVYGLLPLLQCARARLVPGGRA